MALFHRMSDVNEALIRKLAELSRLELEDSEIAGYVKSIGDILGHVDQLRSVDTRGVEPMLYGIDEDLRLREDVVMDFGLDASGRPRVLSSAPETIDGGFKVPPILG
jgi:aspartyl-tRNA(Asn)/glutamyl-tRNA(Gln) amidotransferase subunit C